MTGGGFRLRLLCGKPRFYFFFLQSLRAVVSNSSALSPQLSDSRTPPPTARAIEREGDHLAPVVPFPV